MIEVPSSGQNIEKGKVADRVTARPTQEQRHTIGTLLQDAQRLGALGLEQLGWRNDTEAARYDRSQEWLQEHTAQTSNGSLILGVLHGYDTEKKGKDFIDKMALPVILRKAEGALASGKRIVFLAEGCIGGPKKSEQEVIANVLHKVTKGRVEQDTWDDAAVNVFTAEVTPEGKHLHIDPTAPVVRQMSDEFDEKEVEAGLYAMLRGQDESFLQPSACTKEILRQMQINPDDKQKLYAQCFYPELGQETVFAKVTQQWNRRRVENMLRKIRQIEKEGGIAIVTPGASHAFSLKPVVEEHFDEFVQRLDSMEGSKKNINAENSTPQ